MTRLFNWIFRAFHYRRRYFDKPAATICNGDLALCLRRAMK